MSGCVATANYVPPAQAPLAEVRFESTENRVVNTRVHLHQHNTCDQPALVGLLYSRLIGTDYQASLDTRVPAGQPLSVSIFSSLYRDVSALDVLTQSAQAITAGLGYCEAFIRFTPVEGHRYRVIFNAQHHGCDMDIYEVDDSGTATLVQDARIDNSCHLKPLGNAKVYDGILTRDKSAF